MRIKAVPEEAVNFLASHPVAIVVIGAAAVGGVVFMRHNSVPAPDADPSANNYTSYGSYGMAPLSTGGVISSNYGSAGSYSGIVDSVTNGSAPSPAGQPDAGTTGGLADGSVSALDLFNFEKLKNDQSYNLSLTNLQANLAIAMAQADVAQLGIMSSNYQTSAQLATAFLMSGKQIAIGGISGGVAGSDLNFSMIGFNQGTGGKYDKSDIQFINALNAIKSAGLLTSNSGVSVGSSVPSAPNIASNSNGSFGSAGTSTTSSYAGGSTSAPLQSSGSSVASVVSGSGGASNKSPLLIAKLSSMGLTEYN